MSIADATTNRTYKCDQCSYEFTLRQQIKDKWKKKCPNCGKNKLYLLSADISVSASIDTKKAKTVGFQADLNTERMAKEGTLPEGPKKPWYRKGRKPNLDVLKNPRKYVETGRI